MRGALVLAGGRSERFGGKKAFAELAGRPLILHVLQSAMDVADEVVLAIGREDRVASYAKLVPKSIRILKDTMHEKTPLVGIVTGFEVMKSEYSVVLSCDTPFVQEAVLDLLFTRALESDAAVPKWPNGEIEPLQSVYRVRPSLLAAKLALSEHRFRNLDMIKRLRKVAYVPIRDIKRIDGNLITFFNVNTRRDLRRAVSLYAYS